MLAGKRASTKRTCKGFVITVMVAALLVLGLGGIAQAGDSVTLKAITSFPKNHPHNLGIPLLIKLAQEKSHGKLKINWLGGPEVVKAFDQGEALRRGTIDMLLYTPFFYFKPLSPVFMAKGLSQIPAWEERQSGAFDLWCKIFQEKMNAEYLGNINCIVGFRLFLNKKIAGIGDLKGLKIRVGPLYIPFMKALGVNPITIGPMEIYTAMQRGVVDGFMWPNYAVPGLGWHEVTKYMVNQDVFQIEPATVVNLDKFKSLPPDVQKALKDAVEVMEGVDTARSLARVEEDWKTMAKAGMTKIELPEADAAKFVEMSQEITWKFVNEQAPKYGPELQKLSTKKKK